MSTEEKVIESMAKFATVNPGQMVSCTIQGVTYAVIGVNTPDGVKVEVNSQSYGSFR